MSEQLTLEKHSELPSDERIIESPNLPENDVKLVIISELAGDAKRFLGKKGIRCLDIKASLKLYKSIESHADIRILNISNSCLLCYKEELYIYKNLQFMTVKPIDYILSGKYPEDVRLNCKIIGNKIICNKRTIAKEILEFAEMNNYRIIDTKQGYSGCSVSVINENAIITDDPAIYRAAQNYFNDTLFISKGSIGLKGADYGFIGGCTGKLGKNRIAFNGRLESHSDHNKIIDILDKYNITAVELTSSKLEDIGGIIPLTEAIR